MHWDRAVETHDIDYSNVGHAPSYGGSFFNGFIVNL
jgi:hypothetical protein